VADISLEQAYNELRYGGPELRSRAALALGDIKDAGAVPFLIQALSDPEGEVRAAAAQALIDFRDTRAVPTLIKLLEDRFAPVREAAAITLGLTGDTSAVKALTKQAEMGHKSSPTSEAQHKATIQAVIALGRLKSEKATELLNKILKKGYSSAPSDWQLQLRQAAALGLGYLDTPASVTSLIEVLRDTEAGPIRNSAITALGVMKQEKTFRVLLENINFRPFEDKAQVWRRQEGIVIALGERRDRRAVPYIIPLVNSEYPEVRAALARTLVQLGEDQHGESLLQLLRDRLPEVRAAAAQALGELNIQQAQDALNVVLQDPNRQVANAAAFALDNIRQLPPGTTAAGAEAGRYLPSGKSNREEE
jgi:HEAT repeat protein